MTPCSELPSDGTYEVREKKCMKDISNCDLGKHTDCTNCNTTSHQQKISQIYDCLAHFRKPLS